jgi:hypothetical protein
MRENRLRLYDGMKRRLLNLLTALSLLLCVAVVGLWVRGYLRTDTVCVVRGRTLLYGESSRGAVAFAVYTGFPPSEEPVVQDASVRGWAWQTTPGRDRYMGVKRTLGFYWYYRATPPASVQRILHVPDAAILLAGAFLPALGAARWWRSRRGPKPGICSRCGYDLRATPGRCPECGKVASVSTTGCNADWSTS